MAHPCGGPLRDLCAEMAGNARGGQSDVADSRPTIWDIEPHTVKKHEILRRYLDAWLAIMGQRRTSVKYLDGFAGPGIYSKGEPGSPVIAIDRALGHTLGSRIKASLHFEFIEVDHDRVVNLEKVLKAKFPDGRLRPRRISYHVFEKRFAERLREILDAIEGAGRTIAPTFAFIDPFGFSGIPMDLITRLLRHNGCEVLITFMEGFINRFADPSLVHHIDELYGGKSWRSGQSIEGPAARKRFWLQEYQKQLHDVGGAELVRSFEMVNKFNQTEYFLVFGTNHWRGMEVMKEAMWKVDPTGQYQFSDLTDPNQSLLLDYSAEPMWAAEAREMVWKGFRGLTATCLDVHRFLVERTPYLYRKKSILWVLEDMDRIINRPKPHSYASEDGLIKFAD